MEQRASTFVFSDIYYSKKFKQYYDGKVAFCNLPPDHLQAAGGHLGEGGGGQGQGESVAQAPVA